MSSVATPRWRSSAPSARPARPRPWWRDSTHAWANSWSSMSFTSAKRSSTLAAALSGTPRRRSAAASWACVRGAAESSRRQIWRATASGSASASARLPARLVVSPRSLVIGAACPDRLLRAQAPHRGHALLGKAQAHALLGLGIEPGTHPELLLDLLLDLVGQVRVVAQEVPGVFLALAEL